MSPTDYRYANGFGIGSRGSLRLVPVPPAARPPIAARSLIGLAAGCLYHATPAQTARFGSRRIFPAKTVLCRPHKGQMPPPMLVIYEGKISAKMDPARFLPGQCRFHNQTRHGEHVLQFPAVRIVELPRKNIAAPTANRPTRIGKL